ncbi:MAG: DUF7408 domain-containing protein [Armatimonadota bacterium]
MHDAPRLSLLVALSILALPLCSPAQEVTWEAEAGFGGGCHRGCWTPVRVELRNPGDSLSGRIYLPLRRRMPDQDPHRYSVPVELPSGAHKAYTLYFPDPDSLGRVVLELDGGAATKGVEPPAVLSDHDVSMVVIGDQPSLLAFLQGAAALDLAAYDLDVYPSAYALRPSASGKIELGRGQWGQLPKAWLGWDGVDVAVVTQARLDGAAEAELQALRRWVRLGGTLVVPGGAQAPMLADGPLADLLPMRVSGTRTIEDLSALDACWHQPIARRAALVADGTLREGAQVLMAQGETPLVTAMDVDGGRVIMTAFDYTAEPVRYWDGQIAMWQWLLAHRSDMTRLRSGVLANLGPTDYGGGADYGLAVASVHSRASALPSVWLMLGFLAAYIVVLVPINYAVVVRLGRRELAWLTTPAIILIFVGAAYGTGFALRGHRTLLNRVAIVESSAGQSLARATSYIGIFSPTKTRYDMKLGEIPGGARGTEIGGREGVNVVQEPRWTVQGVPVNMWSTRVVRADHLVDLGGALTGRFIYDGQTLTAEVHNGTRLPLRRCGIQRIGSLGKTESLPAGGDATLSFAQQSPITTLADDMNAPLADRALGELFSRSGPRYYPYAYSGGPMPPGMGSRAGPPPQEPLLVALCDESLTPVTLAGRRARTTDAAVLVVHLPVELAPATGVLIPNWLMQRRAGVATGSVDLHGEWHEALAGMQAGGAVIFEFDAPTGPEGVRPTGMQVKTVLDTPSGPADVSVYNFRRERWESLTSADTVRRPGQCMTADGRVLIRVEAPGGPVNQPVNLRDISLRARVDAS